MDSGCGDLAVFPVAWSACSICRIEMPSYRLQVAEERRAHTTPSVLLFCPASAPGRARLPSLGCQWVQLLGEDKRGSAQALVLLAPRLPQLWEGPLNLQSRGCIVSTPTPYPCPNIQSKSKFIAVVSAWVPFTVVLFFIVAMCIP